MQIDTVIGISYSGNTQSIDELRSIGIRVLTPEYSDLRECVSSELQDCIARCEKNDKQLVIHEVGGIAIKALHEPSYRGGHTVIGALEITKQGVWVAEQIEQKEEFETKDGTISLSVRIMPYSPDGMASRGAVFTLQDVSALRDAVDAADEATALAELQKNEVEQVYATSPLAMGLIDSDMVYLRLNDRLAEINGVPVEQHMGRRIRDIIPAVADQTEKLVNQVLTTETPVLAQRVVGSTTSEPDRMRVWERDWMPFYKSGELSGVSVIVRDITEEVETAEKLREIMRELEHRVKNMLSNVNALINRAAREADTDTEVFETLSKRVRGLANTHALLTAESWSSAMLKSIFSSETVDVYGADRVALSGPDMWITSDATLSLAMAIHELATNAAKYGAFSVAEGRVDISWSRIFDAQGDRLRIEWVETGGPEISPPSRSGFGSQLVKSTLEGSLSGQVDYDWEPNGLRVVINLEFGEVTVPQVG